MSPPAGFTIYQKSHSSQENQLYLPNYLVINQVVYCTLQGMGARAPGLKWLMPGVILLPMGTWDYLCLQSFPKHHETISGLLNMKLWETGKLPSCFRVAKLLPQNNLPFNLNWNAFFLPHLILSTLQRFLTFYELFDMQFNFPLPTTQTHIFLLCQTCFIHAQLCGVSSVTCFW